MQGMKPQASVLLLTDYSKPRSYWWPTAANKSIVQPKISGEASRFSPTCTQTPALQR